MNCHILQCSNFLVLFVFFMCNGTVFLLCVIEINLNISSYGEKLLLLVYIGIF